MEAFRADSIIGMRAFTPILLCTGSLYWFSVEGRWCRGWRQVVPGFSGRWCRLNLVSTVYDLLISGRWCRLNVACHLLISGRWCRFKRSSITTRVQDIQITLPGALAAGLPRYIAHRPQLFARISDLSLRAAHSLCKLFSCGVRARCRPERAVAVDRCIR